MIAAARRVPGASEAVTGRIDVEAALAHRDYMTSNWHDEANCPGWMSTRSRWCAVPGESMGSEWWSWRLPTTAPGGSASCRRWCWRPARAPRCRSRGLAEARPWTNRDITGAKELPRRLVVIGGGPVGVEMAQGFRRLGCEEVTVLERPSRLLAREEPFAGDEVRVALEAEGITVVTDAVVTAWRKGTDGPVTAEGSGTYIGEELLVAAGAAVHEGTRSGNGGSHARRAGAGR